MKRHKVVQYAFLFSIMCLFITTSAHAVEQSNGLAKQDISNCHATYFPEEGKLLIPCVVVIDATGNMQASYRVVLEQLTTADTQQFMVKEWFTNPQDVITPEESSCRAAYLSDEGKLLMPCVDVVDSSGKVESHQVLMGQLNSTLVELPKLEVLAVDGVEVGESQIRSTRSLFGAGDVGAETLTVRGTKQASSAFVTIYKHCKYGGYSVSLTPGSYTLSMLVSKGMKNDDISAIVVPRGLTAILYEHDNFQGRAWKFTSNDDCFVDNGLNDVISSVKIY